MAAPPNPFEAFKKSLSPRAKVLTSTDGNTYVQAKKLWAADYDSINPLAIVQVGSTSDVVKSVNYARENNIVITPRCGAHSLSGLSTVEGGIVVDLSQLRTVRVDAVNRIAWIEGGALGQDVDHEAGEYGLATVLGTVSHTGASGLALHGGYGWLCRKYGLAIDNILSLEAVLADGSVIRASATENTDLFWAFRGAASNFGIVVNFSMRLFPVTNVYCSMLAYPGALAKPILTALLDNLKGQDEELAGVVALTHAPPPPPGAPAPPPGPPPKIALLLACYSGPKEKAQEVTEFLRKFGEPIAPLIPWGFMPYRDWQQVMDKMFDHGLSFYGKSVFGKTNHQAIDEAVEAFEKQPIGGAILTEFYGYGQVQRVPVDSAAYAGRTMITGQLIASAFPPGVPGAAELKPLVKQWVLDTHAVLNRYASDLYQNYELFEAEPEEKVKEKLEKIYGANLPRLKELKKKYDPNNLFRHNANIKP